MAALCGDLDQAAAAASGEAENRIRRSHVGTGERSDKRRTYRFQEDIVVDHITGKSARLRSVMKGGFRLLF